MTKTKQPTKRQTEVRHIRMDIDTSERIEAIAEYTGIPYGRIVNMVMRVYVENNGAGLVVPILAIPNQSNNTEKPQ